MGDPGGLPLMAKQAVRQAGEVVRQAYLRNSLLFQQSQLVLPLLLLELMQALFLLQALLL